MGEEILQPASFFFDSFSAAHLNLSCLWCLVFFAFSVSYGAVYYGGYFHGVKEILADNPYVGCEVLTVNEVYVPSMTPMEKRHNEICKLIPVQCAVDEIPDKNWYKVLFAVEPERMDELISYVAKKGYKGVDFVRSSIEYYEILPQNISKGTALEELRKACGMEDFTFVAAGDYNNDIELLQAADMAYCPSNAAEEVKKVADKVFEQSCEEDFIAAVIDEIFEKLKK